MHYVPLVVLACSQMLVTLIHTCVDSDPPQEIWGVHSETTPLRPQAVNGVHTLIPLSIHCMPGLGTHPLVMLPGL